MSSACVIATATLEHPLAASDFFYEGACWRCVAIQQELGAGAFVLKLQSDRKLQGRGGGSGEDTSRASRHLLASAIENHTLLRKLFLHLFCRQVFLHQSLNCYSLKQSFLNFSMCQNHLAHALKQISGRTSRVPDAAGQSRVGEFSFAMSACVMLVPPFWDHT